MINSFLKELKRRKVAQPVIGYVAMAWLLLQVGSIMVDSSMFPEWGMRALFLVLLAGFPVFVVCAWIFDFTPGGLRRTIDIPAQPSGLTRQAVILVARISEQADEAQFSPVEVRRNLQESGLWAKDFHAVDSRVEDDALIAAFTDAVDALLYAVRLQEHARLLDIPTVIGLARHPDIKASDPLNPVSATTADNLSKAAPDGGIIASNTVYTALVNNNFAMPEDSFGKLVSLPQAPGVRGHVLEREGIEHLDQALRAVVIHSGTGGSSSLVKVLALIFLTAFTGLLWTWLPGLRDSGSWESQTIAVLPFEDTTGDVAAMAMVRGLSDDLFNALAAVEGLNLVARRASRTLDHRDKSVQQIGEILNARLLLEGDIRTDGDLFSVTTWITDTDSGLERWNNIIEKPREQLAQVRLELPAAVAAELNLDPKTTPASGPQAVELDPDMYPLFLEAAGLLKLPQGVQSLGRAETLLETVIAASPDYLPAKAALCRTYLDWFAFQRDASYFDRASEQCTDTLSGSGQNVEVLLALGDLNRMQGNYDQAESYYKQGLGMDSSNVELSLGLARVFGRQGLVDESERLLKDIMLLEPGYWHIHARLGELYRRNGRSEEAISAYAYAELLAPNEPTVINGLGAAYYFAGRFADAAELFERSVQENPTSSALSNSASVWFLAGDYDRAAYHYLQAAELAPTDFRVWLNLADAESQISGRANEAKAHYQLSAQLANENLEVNEKDYVALYHIAWIAANSDEPELANRRIEEALQLAPEDLDVLYYAVQVYNLLDNQQLATRLLVDAMARGFPEDVIKATPGLSGLLQSL